MAESIADLVSKEDPRESHWKPNVGGRDTGAGSGRMVDLETVLYGGERVLKLKV